MASLMGYLDLPPYNKEDLKDDLNTFAIPPDVLQLQVDALNVLEDKVDISTFPKDYQEKIINYYRFSATRMNTQEDRIAKRTNDTMDII